MKVQENKQQQNKTDWILKILFWKYIMSNS